MPGPAANNSNAAVATAVAAVAAAAANTGSQFEFVPPPETKVYTPTKEEFGDALSFLERIRPEAEQYGIVKIRPPEDWQPPFAVDVDKLKFTPRIQRLNELEAHTRIKLNFLDQVAKFWELQGTTLKIPMVEGRALDLYTLKKFVVKEGGMEKVNADKKWTKVATDMGFNVTSNKSVGAVLKAHYERILYPLEIFEREEQKKKMEEMKARAEVKEEMDEEDEPTNTEPSETAAAEADEDEKEYKPHNIPGRMNQKIPADKDKAGRRSKRYDQGEPGSGKKANNTTATVTASPTSGNEGNSFSKELARLQFFGAGPKMAGLPSEKSSKEKTRGMKLNFDYDPLAKYMCQNCGKGDSEEQMLLCDGCDDSYHTFCLMPPLAEIPKGDWRCPKCIAAEVSKPTEAFGFEQAQKEYTLQSFGEMADQFKQDYFRMPVHLIATSAVEKEYWRILENIDEDVMVEYGADLHTMDHGSGFPTLVSKNLSKEDEIYAKHDFNLNNLPVVANSILRCIDMNISGMKVPWLYVGMCFSTFCWHTEDHWTPSINYLHWGEPKTWYGIPAKWAERAESVMRESAKELFTGQPDLLHHIVTTMNPNILQAHGIPVFRTDQHAGEFVITFPRGYHAGFNQGYNLAEAVNYAPPEWLEMGRKCVEHYSLMRRYCVFCHDELVCNMATQANKLTLQVAAATYKDMLVMVDEEKKYRRQLLLAGVRTAEREPFELLPDDERQCALCKTTCFLSALTSVDSKDNEIVCLRHFKAMECDPEKLVLRYRYTLDELASLLQDLKTRAESYEVWVKNVQKALAAKGDDRSDLEDLKDYLIEANDRKYPDCELLKNLQVVINEADKCQTVADQLDNKKVRTRTRGIVEAKYRLTVQEIELFVHQLEMLPVKVNGHEAVVKLMAQVEEFQKEASRLLDQDQPDVDEIQKCTDLGSVLDVELPELPKLKSKYKQTLWLEEVNDILDEPQSISYDQLKEMQEQGTDLPPHPAVEKALGRIEGLMAHIEVWKEKSAECMAAKQKWPLSKVEELVKEGESISGGLPNLAQLRDAVRKAKEWYEKASALKSGSGETYPFLDSLEQLVAKGKNLPVRLESLNTIETQVANSRAWRERTARVFLKKNSHLSLLDVLCPRVDIGLSLADSRKKKRQAQHKADGEGVGAIPHPSFVDLSHKDLSDPRNFFARFRRAEKEEKDALMQLRKKNRQEEREKNGKGKAMIECELCLEHFHPLHVPLPKSQSGADKHSENNGSASPSANGNGTATTSSVTPTNKPSSLRDVKFLCPACTRSRRPRLETILSLLVSLQKLTVRLPESEALQCLTERAMSWQDEARKILKTEEVDTALNKIQSHEKNKGKDDAALPTSLPEVKLSKSAVDKLERLMMEGDLLEVSLDESQHISRILQATEPRRSKQYPDLLELEVELESVREEKLRAKKKRKLEATAASNSADEDQQQPHSQQPGPKAKRGKDGEAKKKKEVTTKRNKKEQQQRDESEDEQEDCSASPSCLRPTGKEVHWVQCDACLLWFHLYCIGLKQEQVSEDEDYWCKSCKHLRHKKRKTEAK